MGHSAYGHKELDMMEQLKKNFLFFFLLPSLGCEQFQPRDCVCSFCTASDWNIAQYRVFI